MRVEIVHSTQNVTLSFSEGQEIITKLYSYSVTGKYGRKIALFDPTPAFWDIWKNNKDLLKGKGIRVYREMDFWKVVSYERYGKWFYRTGVI